MFENKDQFEIKKYNMRLKCSSCGASQEIENTTKCNFCGSIINPNSQNQYKSEIIFDKNNSKITLYEKSLEYISNENEFLVLLKNIPILKSSIFNINKVINPIYYQISFALSVTAFCFYFYEALIPLKIDKSFTAFGSTIEQYEQSETSFGLFLFALIFFVLPLLGLTHFLKKAHNNSKKAFIKDDEHFIQIDVLGVSSKTILIGNKIETEKIYNTIKDKIEFVKMRQD